MILAIDTATAYHGLAIWDDGVRFEQVWRADPRPSATLVPRLRALLESAGVALDDVRMLAVTVGPGSFTGIRSGLATAQGIAAARGLPLVGVGSLEAMAWPVRTLGPVATILPARRDWILAVYEADADGVSERTPPAIVPVATPPSDVRLVVVEEAGHTPSDHSLAVVVGPRRPSAIAELAAWRSARGQTGPTEPVYLRPPQISEPRSRPPAARDST